MAIINQTRDQTIVRRYLANESLGQLAEDYGVTRQRIFMITQAAGAYRPQLHTKRATAKEQARVARQDTRRARIWHETELLFKRGLNPREIAAELSTSRQTILKVPVIRAAVDRRRTDRVNRHKDIISLREAGLTYQAVGAILGCHWVTVARVLHQDRPDLTGRRADSPISTPPVATLDDC